jgi:hypothetical protein
VSRRIRQQLDTVVAGRRVGDKSPTTRLTAPAALRHRRHRERHQDRHREARKPQVANALFMAGSPEPAPVPAGSTVFMVCCDPRDDDGRCAFPFREDTDSTERKPHH